MEFFVIIVLLVFGTFYLFRSNTKRGEETVRAHVFLGGIEAGLSVKEANRVAGFEMISAPSEIVRGAIDRVKAEFGGKQLPMISKAYGLGMASKMSASNPNAMRSSGRSIKTHEKEVNEKWVLPFVYYYILSQLRYAYDNKIPETIRQLALGKVDGRTKQSLLVDLQNYLTYAHQRDRHPSDYDTAVNGAKDFLQVELKVLNSPTALRRFIRRNSHRENENEISVDQLEIEYNDVVKTIGESDEAGEKLHSLLLADSIEEFFLSAHGMPIEAYQNSMTAHTTTGLKAN